MATRSDGPSAARTLVFATRNPGKVRELRALLADSGLEVLGLDDLAHDVPEVVEDGDGFAANAIKKARAVSQAAGLPALADDSGLEVDALDGAPGVYSARYAGEGASTEANNTKLLEALREVPDERRGARFRSVLALADVTGALGEDTITTGGTCQGRITRSPRGAGGFGYDPLFYVPELDATFAELDVASKGEISHRARAMAAMKPHLTRYFRLAKPEDSG